MDLTPIYLQRLEVTADLVRNVKADQLGDGTPCSEFDVRKLVNHIIGGTLMFAKTVTGEMRFDPGAELPDFLAAAGDDPRAALDPVVEEAAGVWSEPGVAEKAPEGAPPAKTLLRVALGEAVLHGWDLAKATGQAYEIPEPIATSMLEGMRRMFPAERPPALFGPEIPIADDAPAADRLVAFTGRRP